MTEAEPKTETLTLAKGAGISLVGRGFSRGLLLLGMAFLTRALSWEQFGLFSLGWTVLQIGSALGPSGLAQAVIHFGTRYWKQDEKKFAGLLWRALALSSAVAALTAIVIYLLSAPLADWFYKPGLDSVLRWTAAALACAIVLRVASGATRITRRMQFSALVEDILPALVFALGGYIFTSVLGWGLTGGLLALLLGFALGLVISLWGVFRFFPESKTRTWDRSPTWRELSAFSVPSALAAVSGTVALLAPRFIAGYYLSGAQIGLFQAAYQLATLTSIILASFNAIFAPLVSSLHREDHQQLDELYKVSTKWGLYVSLPFFIVMILFPAPLLRFVFGESSEAGVTAFVILTVAQLVNTATGGIGTLLVMTGFQKNWMVISLWTLVGVIIASILMLRPWGLTGMAVATSLGIVGMFLWALVEGWRVLRVWPYDRRYWKGLLAGLASLAAVLVYQMIGRGTDLLALAVAGILAFGVFALTLFLLGLDAEDLRFLQAIRERLTNRNSPRMNADER